MNKSFDYYCEIGWLRYVVQYVWEKKNIKKILFLPSGEKMGELLVILPGPQDANLKVYLLGFPTQKKKWNPCHPKWWPFEKFLVIYGLDSSFSYFLYLFLQKYWFSPRVDSPGTQVREKPWHWIPCRLVYGAKVHDLMPLQTNLCFLRGKNCTTKISAYFAKRCCLNKIRGEKK